MICRLSLGLLAVFVAVAAGQNAAVPAHKRLAKELSDKYDEMTKYGRPVEKFTDTLDVAVGYTLTSVVGLDKDSQVLTTTGWFMATWKDAFLSWDPKDYDGVTEVRLPASEIWCPDFALYNDVYSSFDDDIFDTLALITSSGDVTFIPPVTLTTTCGINHAKDEQSCELKFGSWTHHKDRLNLVFMAKEDVDTDYLTKNSELEVTSTSAKINTKKYDCCPEEYQDVTFTINLKADDKDDHNEM